MPEIDATSTTSLLVVGKTGVGKSSTCNSIIGSERFIVGDSTSSVTQRCQSDFAQQQGRMVKVVDMPGSFNEELEPEEDVQNIVENAAEAVAETPDGYDAILFVVRYGRFTREDRKAFACLKAIFGETFLKNHGILVVTHGDDFVRRPRRGETFKQWCSHQRGTFEKLFQEVNGRVVLFQNLSDDQDVRKHQLEELFEMVEKVKRNHRYTPRLFELATAERERLEVLPITLATEAEIHQLYQELRDLANGRSARDVARLRQLLERADGKKTEIQNQDNGRGILNNVLKALDNLHIAIEATIQAINQGIEATRLAEAAAERRHRNAMEHAENRRAEAERRHRKAMEHAENRRAEAEMRYQELRAEQGSKKSMLKKVMIGVAITLGIAVAVAAITVTIVYAGPAIVEVLEVVAAVAKAAAPSVGNLAAGGVVGAVMSASKLLNAM